MKKLVSSSRTSPYDIFPGSLGATRSDNNLNVCDPVLARSKWSFFMSSVILFAFKKWSNLWLYTVQSCKFRLKGFGAAQSILFAIMMFMFLNNCLKLWLIFIFKYSTELIILSITYILNEIQGYRHRQLDWHNLCLAVF